MRTLLVYLLALGAVATGVRFGFPELVGVAAARETEARVHGSGAVPVVVSPVRRTPFAEALEALGTVHANESVEITANRSDHINALHFDDGQEVATGQLLFELNAEEEKAQHAEALALRDERQTAFDRVQKLYEQSISSPEDLVTARALLAAAEARVQRLQATINDHLVRAPFSGTLGLRRVSIGAFVQPSTVVTTLDDLAVVKLDFTIPEPWLPHVRSDMKITATSGAWPGFEFSGVVVTLGTRLDERTRSVTVRARLANPERRLRPGMLLQVRVDRGERPVLQVPEEAVVPVGNEHFVYRVGAGDVVEKVRVAVGRRRVGAVEITAGLAVGDRVVVEGLVRVRAGEKVAVVSTRVEDGR